MPKVYDAESLMTDIKAIMVANLNTKIAAIEAEKIANGGVTTGILPIDSTNGYFEQSWSDKILNQKAGIFFGIEDVAAQGIGPATLETYRIFCEIVLVDIGVDQLAKNRVYRYTRALKEVFQEYFMRASGTARVKIETVRPFSFKLDLNSSEEVKVGGISLTLTLS